MQQTKPLLASKVLGSLNKEQRRSSKRQICRSHGGHSHSRKDVGASQVATHTLENLSNQLAGLQMGGRQARWRTTPGTPRAPGEVPKGGTHLPGCRRIKPPTHKGPLVDQIHTAVDEAGGGDVGVPFLAPEAVGEAVVGGHQQGGELKGVPGRRIVHMGNIQTTTATITMATKLPGDHIIQGTLPAMMAGTTHTKEMVRSGGRSTTATEARYIQGSKLWAPPRVYTQ